MQVVEIKLLTMLAQNFTVMVLHSNDNLKNLRKISRFLKESIS